MRSILSSKRGDVVTSQIIIPVWAMVIAVTAILIPFSAEIASFNSDHSIEKRAEAIEMAMVIDAMIASPYNTQFIYPSDTFMLSYEFSPKNIVIVGDNSDDLNERTFYYPFVTDLSTRIVHTKLTPEHTLATEGSDNVVPLFTRLSDRVLIEQHVSSGNIETMSCGAAGSLGVSNPSIFDHYILESEMLRESRSLSYEVKSHDISTLFIQGSYDDLSKNPIMITISSNDEKIDERRRLACLIANEILSDFEIRELIKTQDRAEITSVSIVESDSFDILSKSNYAILFSVGNDKLPADKQTLTEEVHDLIIAAVERGVSSYE